MHQTCQVCLHQTCQASNRFAEQKKLVNSDLVLSEFDEDTTDSSLGRISVVLDPCLCGGNSTCSTGWVDGYKGIYLGGGNSNIFGIFTPKIGEDFHFDEHICQMGWFNHQLDNMWNCFSCVSW